MTLKKATLDGRLLESGFWLYVITASSDQTTLLYVGMTGDSSSTNARSPINRLGKHLGSNTRNNSLMKHLGVSQFDPISSTVEIAATKLFEESDDMTVHALRYSKVNACERLLAEGLALNNHLVLNTVNCQARPDRKLWQHVRREFSSQFPELLTYQGKVAASQPFTNNDLNRKQLRFGKAEKFLFPDIASRTVIKFGSTEHECEWNPRYGADRDRSGVLRIGPQLARQLRTDRVYRAELEADGVRICIARPDWNTVTDTT